MSIRKLVWVVVGVASVSTVLLAADQSAAVMARARESLGGDKSIAAISTFVLKGSKKIHTQTQNATASFRIACQLPAKFVWKEDAGIRGAVVIGFDGNRVISNVPESATGQTSGQLAGMSRDSEQLMIGKTDFSVLTLGLFASSFAAHPLTFSTSASGATAVDIRSQAGFAATMLFDATTHLPDRLGYKVAAPQGGGLQIRQWIYSDYRVVDGHKVPHRLTLFTGRDGAKELLQEAEWVVDEFLFNVTLDASEFRS